MAKSTTNTWNFICGNANSNPCSTDNNTKTLFSNYSLAYLVPIYRIINRILGIGTKVYWSKLWMSVLDICNQGIFEFKTS